MRLARSISMAGIVGVALTAFYASSEAGTASAARVIDAEGGGIVALHDVVVWRRSLRRTGPGTILMRRVGGRTSRIPGVRPVINLNSFDLGVDRRGRVIAVYYRCDIAGACTGPYLVDVRSGGERRLALPVRAGCTTNKGSASVWKEQVAYTRSCRVSRDSGVFLVRNGRSRRLIPLNRTTAKSTGVDLVRGFIAVGVLVVSTDVPTCRMVVATAPPDFRIGPSYLTPGGVLWWVEEDVGDFGGANTVLRSAAIGPGCSVTPRGPPRSLNRYNDDTNFQDFAVDGTTFYVGNLAVPLKEIN